MTMVSVTEETEAAITALRVNAPVWVHDALKQVMDEAMRIATDTGWSGQSSRTYLEAMTTLVESMKNSAQTHLDGMADVATDATSAIREAGGSY
ncbi:MAG: hypothetical protein S0880_07945 [Actinomycetota bacterium]|nr:hypothetical protein [Actinomycetota bacterium]